MMVQNRRSASCFDIGSAPTADEEVTFIDGVDDPDDVSSVMTASQRSSVITADSGRASSQSTLKSREKDDGQVTKRSTWYRKMVVCRIALLDGSTFEPKAIDKGSNGNVVFDKVTKHLDIIETDYFGLTYRDKSGKKFWLDNDKKISKQVNGGTWVFEFQLKFYPPDPMSLKEDITRYQLCLQLRVDIFNGKLPCSFVTYALLGSYTVQAELGDWDPVEFGHGIEYLHDFDFAPTQQPELLEKIAELHKHHKGQSPTVAEAHFLENTKKLAMYGVDMHDAKDSENKDISLGVCANGILVYKDRLRINRFVWPKILKLSYKRNNFYIKVRPGEFEPHERTIGFRCENHKLAKRVWKTCVEHHAFFRLKDADEPNSDTLFPRFNSRFRYSGRTAHQARKAAEHAGREEPHIARTAERRSLSHHPDKTKSLDDMANKKMPYDENDKYANKDDDEATTKMRPDGDAATLEKDGRYQTAPNGGDDAVDRLHHRPGEEPTVEGPPGYSADASMLSDGGKKGKKDKEDERRKKKEEERKKKEDDKERKRLEKEKKKHPVKSGQETSIDDFEPEPATMEQTQHEKEKDRKSGGFFGKFGKKSPKEKSEKDKDSKHKKEEKEAEEAKIEQDAQIEESDIAATKLLVQVPRIEIDEATVSDPENIDPDVQEYQTSYQSAASVNQSEPLSGNTTEEVVAVVVKGDDLEDVANENQFILNEQSENQSELKGDNSMIVAVNVEISEDGTKGEVEAVILTETQLKEDFMQLLRETPQVTSQSKLGDVKNKISHDPRYQAVPSDAKREEWFNEYVNNKLKEDYMRLLRETPTIHSQSRWKESKKEIDHDPRYTAVKSEKQREEWFDEYVNNLLKSEYMQLLKDTPFIHSGSRWEDVKDDISFDPRYKAVPTDAQREAWFDEYIQNLKKEEFMQLLSETPNITSYSRYNDVREDISHDPRFASIDTEAQREQYFDEYVQELKKAGFVQLLRDTPDITGQSKWHIAKGQIETDPRYHAVGSELLRAKWFNEYVNNLMKEDFEQLLRETPDVTSQSRLSDVEHKISYDPRYQAVDSDAKREEWFNEYVKNMLKAEFMCLLKETPTIHSQSRWEDARQEIDLDPRFQAVGSEAQRKEWFNEHVHNLLKADFMQLLKDTPSIHSQSRWEGVKNYIESDPRYQAVGSGAQREAWFNEYIQNLKKEEFMQLLSETPDITSYSRYNDVREDISSDPRYANIDTEAQRKQYFNDYVEKLKKAGFVQLLKDTPSITGNSNWHIAKRQIDTDPRYHAVDSELLRAKWFNEYVNNLAGLGGAGDFGMTIGDYKSIDRKLEFLPLTPPSVTVRTKSSSDEPMPFFEPIGETDVDAMDKKRMPPPVAKKPRGHSGYESEEDRLMGVPVTVTTESYKYNPDSDDVPRSTSNIPIVETKTHKVTYERDGIPYETEDSILISAHSVTTKSQTIDTTTYKTEKDGVVETRVERKITVTTDGDNDLDHDALLRAAIEEVTHMNPDLSVEKIECMRQIEENR